MPIEPEPTTWVFPTPDPQAPDIVALGADTEPGTLLAAYRSGLFPMRASPDFAEMAWWSPEERGVLPLSQLRLPRSLRQARRRFEIRVDTAFDEVIAHCAAPGRDGGWIDAEIEAAFTRLHRLGWAHSVETWREGRLVGGLYGVAIGGLFAGESMFHHERDASKVALAALVDLLRDEHADQRLIDTQWRTEHLATLGVIEVPRAAYLAELPALLRLPLPAVFDPAAP